MIRASVVCLIPRQWAAAVNFDSRGLYVHYVCLRAECVPEVKFFLQVHRVFSKGVASQEGTIQRGDLVLSINGKSLANSVHGDVLNALHQARLHKYAVIVIQKEKDKANNSSRLEISATGRKCVGSGKDVSMEIGTGMIFVQEYLEGFLCRAY